MANYEKILIQVDVQVCDEFWKAEAGLEVTISQFLT